MLGRYGTNVAEVLHSCCGGMALMLRRCGTNCLPIMIPHQPSFCFVVLLVVLWQYIAMSEQWATTLTLGEYENSADLYRVIQNKRIIRILNISGGR
jgi:hypothetical protein